MIRFARPELKQEFERALHPILRELSIKFGNWSVANGLPPPTATDISRAIKFYDENGLPTIPTSWHLVDAAIDWRIRDYTVPQLKQVIAWWEAELNWKDESAKPAAQRHWEFITKVHGTGPHLHVAIRDAAWRRLKQSESR